MIGFPYLIRPALIFAMVLSNIGASVSILAGTDERGVAMGKEMAYGSAVLFILLALSVLVIYRA